MKFQIFVYISYMWFVAFQKHSLVNTSEDPRKATCKNDLKTKSTTYCNIWISFLHFYLIISNPVRNRQKKIQPLIFIRSKKTITKFCNLNSCIPSFHKYTYSLFQSWKLYTNKKTFQLNANRPQYKLHKEQVWTCFWGGGGPCAVRYNLNKPCAQRMISVLYRRYRGGGKGPCMVGTHLCG